jgi:DNA-binding NtrC family response regulator
MSTKNPVLMIVEDDPDLLEVWKDLFELSDYQVHAFTSAQAALAQPDAVRETRLLITDYHLTDCNGIELIQAARRIQPQLPAVLLTGLRQEHISAAVADEPDVALFFKPVSMRTIETHVMSVLAPETAGAGD